MTPPPSGGGRSGNDAGGRGGPGGGRNRLIAEARNDLIASFDDDSYPLDLDYFARVRTLVEAVPDAAIFAASIFHRGELPTSDNQEVSPTASFVACGAVLRRHDFIESGGFVPLVVAYGMEEEDLAIRLLDRGRKLFATPWLRIFHDTDLSHHQSARVTSGTIANIALLASLRYPPSYWPYGALQVANRVMWCLRVGRYAGVLSGLAAIPGHLTRHRKLRAPVSLDTMRLRREVRVANTKPFAIDVSERSAAT